MSHNLSTQQQRQIVSMWLQGIPINGIAQQHFITIEDVKQILRENGKCVNCNS
jgi:DNA-binding CsgD family transcriptional regulator